MEKNLNGTITRSTILLYVVFAIISIIVSSKVYGTIIVDTSITFHLNQQQAFDQFLGWNPNGFFGKFFGASTFLVSVIPLFSSLEHMGIPISAYSAIWLCLILFISLIFSFKLTKKFSPNQDLISYIAIPIIYTFSPFFLVTKGTGLIIWLFLHALAPGFLLYTLKFFENNQWKYLFYSALIAFFSFGVNPVFIVIFSILAILSIILTRPKTSKIILFVIVMLLASLSWTLGILYQLFFLQSNVNNALNLEDYKMYSQSSSNLETMIGRGFWALYSSYNNESSVYMSSEYSRGTIAYLALFGIVLISLSSFVTKKNRITISVLLIYVISVFIGIGGYPKAPTSELYILLYKTIPFFSILRDGFKFAILIDLTIMIGLALFIKNNSKTKSIILLILAVLFVFPTLANPLVGKSSMITIPPYWYTASSWINSNTNDNFILHYPAPYFQVYTWGRLPSDISVALFNRVNIYSTGPLVNIGPGYNIYTNIENQNWPEFLGFYGIGYILQKDDLDFVYYPTIPHPNETKAILQSLKNLTQVNKFENLTIYKINEDLVRPHIYATGSCTSYLPQNYSDLTKFISNGANKTTIFAKTTEVCSEISDYQNIKLNITKKSNAEYQIIVNGDADTYYLVFTETYDPGWIVVDFSSLLSPKINMPFEVNNLQNGYYISGLSNNYTLIYVPRIILSIGLLLQIIALIYVLLLSVNNKHLNLTDR